MAASVSVRTITNDEGNRLLRIVRRSSGSVVTWHRAQMVLLSALRDPCSRSVAQNSATGDPKPRGAVRPLGCLASGTGVHANTSSCASMSERHEEPPASDDRGIGHDASSLDDNRQVGGHRESLSTSDSRATEPSDRQRISRTPWKVVAMVAGALGVLVAIYFGFVQKDSTSEDVLRAEFSTPREGALVPWHTPPVSGVLSGSTKGKRLWLVQFKDGEHGVHPADNQCRIGPRTWSCAGLYLGTGPRGELGKVFTVTLLAFKVGSSADRIMLGYDGPAQHYATIEVPDGARELASVLVRRR